MPTPSIKSATIHTERDWSLASMVDKILNASAKTVFLVVPEGALVGQQLLNFRLLRREAESAGKELVIVSSDPRIQGLASKAGLKVHQLTEDFSEDRGGNGGNESAPHDALRYEEKDAVYLAPKRVSDIFTPLSGKHDGAVRNVPPHRSFGAPRGQKYKVVPTPPATHLPPQNDMRGNGIPEVLLRKFAKPYAPYSEEEMLERASIERVSPRRKFHVFAFFVRSFPRIRAFLPRISFGTQFSLKLVLGIFLALIFGVGGFVAYTALPTVNITIFPRVQTAEFSIPVRLDSHSASVDTEKYVVLGQILEESYEQSRTFDATGKENVEDYASGAIRVFNEYSSAPQTLVERTRFISQDGQLFRTTRTVVIPGARVEDGKIIPSSTLVDVRAAEPGEKYNISPSTFSIPGFSGTPKFTTFYGKSESAMTGGMRGTVAVVKEADITSARQSLTSAVGGRASDQLRAKIPSSYFLVPDALQEISGELTIKARAGERIEKFDGKAVAIARAVIFKKEDAEAIVDAYSAKQYASTSDIHALPDRAINYAFTKKDFEKGEFQMELAVKQKLATSVDTQRLLEDILGKREEEVRGLIANYPGLERAHAVFWPFWVHGVPTNKDRVFINVKYSSEDGV